MKQLFPTAKTPNRNGSGPLLFNGAYADAILVFLNL
jgi:hypothetical protein